MYRKLTFFMLLSLTCIIPQLVVGQSKPAKADEIAILNSIQALLKAYGTKDTATFYALCEPNVLLLGVDSAEVNQGRAQVMRQLKEDYLLWERMEFEPIHTHQLLVTGAFASVFFDVQSHVQRPGAMDAYYLRLVTIWHKKAGKWYLAQSMNAVPTKGQSAAAIARRYNLLK